jgi:hypothetical protein
MTLAVRLACLFAALAACASLAACSSSGKGNGFGDLGGDVDAALDGATVGPGDQLDATLGDYDGGGGGTSDGSLFSDAQPDVASDGCVPGEAGPPPFPQRCTAATANECDTTTDTALTGLGVSAALLNGAGGNGFDDDCDGLVDEGCTCPGSGTTRDCYLVPATQIDPSTKAAVGWCATNAKGSLDCAGNEFPKWSGTCRGAQPPYRHDVCATGDFNCDGLQENSDTQDCQCKIGVVQCPTAAVTFAPYPDPAHIPLVDGTSWVTDPASRALTKNWTWTVIGGDCDNVLPHPSFALYNTTVSTTLNARKGTRTPVKLDNAQNPPRYVATPGEPLISMQAAAYGNGVAGGQVYPAFGLSGDYLVQGEWDLNGQHYVCTQKVQVRAPGVRAELCWDTVGGSGSNTNGNDIDLHFARLQGATGCTKQGWDTVCPIGTSFQDCWYSDSSGCRDSSPSPPAWGYPDSPDPTCMGWSTRRNSPSHTQGCTNPRLDKDNVSCDRGIDDPTSGDFCGPENINVDNPKDGDAFVVGVNHYSNHAGTSNAKSHVNIYCNGERVLSSGYNPVTAQAFPVLITPGTELTGDWWTVATVRTHVAGGQITSCDVAAVPPHHADPTRDGSLCVDSTANATPAPYKYNYVNHQFIDHAALQGGTAGGQPTLPAAWCKH